MGISICGGVPVIVPVEMYPAFGRVGGDWTGANGGEAMACSSGLLLIMAEARLICPAGLGGAAVGLFEDPKGDGVLFKSFAAAMDFTRLCGAPALAGAAGFAKASSASFSATGPGDVGLSKSNFEP